MTNRHADPRRWIWQLVLAAGIISTLVEIAIRAVSVHDTTELLVNIVTAWALVLGVGWIAVRRSAWVTDWLKQNKSARVEALERANRLELQNALLQTIAASADTGLALNALAKRINGIVECDRIGLALLKPNGEEFQTITSRVSEEERRSRPRSDLEFPLRSSLIGAVVQSREPLIVGDLSQKAADHLDANVLSAAGFRSAVLLPLVTKGRVVGTFNVVSRQPEAFQPSHIESLTSVAEILAMAHVAQQLQIAIARLKTTETMAEMILAVANDISGALQTIVGHCDLLEREYPDASLRRDLGTIVRQAHRVFDLLERMRAATEQRVREVAATVSQVEE